MLYFAVSLMCFKSHIFQIYLKYFDVTRHTQTDSESVRAGRHSAGAVDLRRVVQVAGGLIQEKVRKECLCVVSGSARCTMLHDEDEV